MKKIVALFLSLLLITLVSCEKEEVKKKTEENKDEIVEVVEGDIFAERAQVDDELPDKSYGGRKFRVVGQLSSEFNFNDDSINKGNLILDAKHKRDTLVEERFDVIITPVFDGKYPEVASWVSKSVLSGVDEFDLLVHQGVSTGSITLQNLFVDWYDVPYVDFTKPWWAKSTVTDLTYDGKCIAAISDLNSTAIGFSFCMVFNKNLANSYDLTNLYDMVNEGKWTFENFYNIVKDIYLDTDGSTDKSPKDFFGVAQGHDYLHSFLYAFDNPIMAKNEEGVPTIVLKTEKINNIVDSIYDYCYNTAGVYYSPDNGYGDSIFLEKRSIFNFTSIAALLIEGYRNFEDEYGLLPLPKWNESQNEYYTTVSGGVTVLTVPKTAKDLEFVGIITEALSAESYKQVTPTYYEIALKTRYLRDNESKKMLDILIDGRKYDFGYIYNGWKATLGSALPTLMAEGSSNFESFYNKHYQTSRLHYRSIIKCFDRL